MENDNMITHEQRKWMTDAIWKSFELIIFKHEEERLKVMLAKYADPRTEPTALEIKEDIKWLDDLHALKD